MSRLWLSAVVAAGGTLSFLIPPSLGFVVYGMLTEQSIGKLLVSGILPGIVLSLAFIAVIVVEVKLDPDLAPATPGRGKSWKEKIRALGGVWETLLVFCIVMGGIYLGFVNPTEAGAIGATALFRHRYQQEEINLEKPYRCAYWRPSRISVLVLFLVAGANVFSYFLALSTIPTAVSSWMAALAVSRYVILTIIIVIYLILGCFLDAISMMVSDHARHFSGDQDIGV